MAIPKVRTALAAATALCGLQAAWPAPAQTTVAGDIVGVVTNGGSPTVNNSVANTSTITLGSSRNLLNWNSLNLAANQTLNFVFSAQSDTVLNRVVGGSFSSIDGSLNSYIGAVGGATGGNVWIINPNGILFGSTASVNVGGLLASTLDMTDADFFGGSAYSLTGPGTTAITVANGAQISTSAGPLVLVAGRIHSAGTLNASGDVAIVAASDVTVAMNEGSPLSITIRQGTPIGGALIDSVGTISGDNVYLAAASRTGVTDALLNVSGAVTATSATASDRGIVLAAGTSASGVTVASGGGNDTAAPVRIELSGALDSATDVDLSSNDQLSGAGAVVAARNVHASADGIVLGSVDAGSNIVLLASTSGIGNGSASIDLAAGGDIVASGPARGTDIALSAGGNLVTDALTARDDVVVRANGTVTLGDVTSGTTVDALGPVDSDGVADTLAGASLFGSDVDLRGNGVVLGSVDANGAYSDIVINGGLSGIGTGSVDLDLAAGGYIRLWSPARGLDVAMFAGDRIDVTSITARDDIALRSSGIGTTSLESGATVDGLAPVDTLGAADVLVGATLVGHDIDVYGNRVRVGTATANGANSDVRVGQTFVRPLRRRR